MQTITPLTKGDRPESFFVSARDWIDEHRRVIVTLLYATAAVSAWVVKRNIRDHRVNRITSVEELEDKIVTRRLRLKGDLAGINHRNGCMYFYHIPLLHRVALFFLPLPVLTPNLSRYKTAAAAPVAASAAAAAATPSAAAGTRPAIGKRCAAPADAAPSASSVAEEASRAATTGGSEQQQLLQCAGDAATAAHPSGGVRSSDQLLLLRLHEVLLPSPLICRSPAARRAPQQQAETKQQQQQTEKQQRLYQQQVAEQLQVVREPQLGQREAEQQRRLLRRPWFRHQQEEGSQGPYKYSSRQQGEMNESATADTHCKTSAAGPRIMRRRNRENVARIIATKAARALHAAAAQTKSWRYVVGLAAAASAAQAQARSLLCRRNAAAAAPPADARPAAAVRTRTAGPSAAIAGATSAAAAAAARPGAPAAAAGESKAADAGFAEEAKERRTPAKEAEGAHRRKAGDGATETRDGDNRDETRESQAEARVIGEGEESPVERGNGTRCTNTRAAAEAAQQGGKGYADFFEQAVLFVEKEVVRRPVVVTPVVKVRVPEGILLQGNSSSTSTTRSSSPCGSRSGPESSANGLVSNSNGSRSSDYSRHASGSSSVIGKDTSSGSCIDPHTSGSSTSSNGSTSTSWCSSSAVEKKMEKQEGFAAAGVPVEATAHTIAAAATALTCPHAAPAAAAERYIMLLQARIFYRPTGKYKPWPTTTVDLGEELLRRGLAFLDYNAFALVASARRAAASPAAVSRAAGAVPCAADPAVAAAVRCASARRNARTSLSWLSTSSFRKRLTEYIKRRSEERRFNKLAAIEAEAQSEKRGVWGAGEARDVSIAVEAEEQAEDRKQQYQQR